VAKANEQLNERLKKLKEKVEHSIEVFKQKRIIMADCRKEQREKERDLSKVESQLKGIRLRANHMERDLENESSHKSAEKKEIEKKMKGDVAALRDKLDQKGKELVNARTYVKEITADLE